MLRSSYDCLRTSRNVKEMELSVKQNIQLSVKVGFNQLKLDKTDNLLFGIWLFTLAVR